MQTAASRERVAELCRLVQGLDLRMHVAEVGQKQCSCTASEHVLPISASAAAQELPQCSRHCSLMIQLGPLAAQILSLSRPDSSLRICMPCLCSCGCCLIAPLSAAGTLSVVPCLRSCECCLLCRVSAAAMLPVVPSLCNCNAAYCAIECTARLEAPAVARLAADIHAAPAARCTDIAHGS